jgi:hypothetical protein
VLDWMLFSIYTVVTFAFIPLFVSIMALFQITFPELLTRIKVKIIISFAVLMAFLIARLYLYIDLKNLHLIFSAPTIYSTIPFYISEIIIALSLALFLYISDQMQKKQRTPSENLEG